MTYDYNDRKPEFIGWDELTEQQKLLLTESKTFCMLPWCHIHAYPTGQAYPCCLGHQQHPVGDFRKETIESIWNNEKMRELRRNMLDGIENPACSQCYEQESHGFFSMRYSSNKRFGHYIDKVAETKTDGSLDKMELTYWDIRFSNLCNLRCRSCGHIFSSNWYDDQMKLMDEEHGPGYGAMYAKKHSRIEYAGRTQLDMWEQLEPHLDHVEHIYFAGGEPLIMEEHYRILNALLARGKTRVRLIYNTNFTELTFKKQNVLELWNQFDNVCIGASLDAMGPLGELMRKNTVWSEIERNREDMMRICPQVDFYISPTLSVMNVHQLPSFHKTWVEKGYIKPQDLNVNILQGPHHYRIDILPKDMKARIKDTYEEHIEWLRPQDSLKRAVTGFESAINFMMADEKQHLIPDFWKKTELMDKIRNETLIDIVPELKDMR